MIKLVMITVLVLLIISGCTNTNKLEPSKELVINYTTSNWHCPKQPCFEVDIYSNGDVTVFDGWNELENKVNTKNIGNEKVEFIKTELIKNDFFNSQCNPQQHTNEGGVETFYFNDGIKERTITPFSWQCVPESVSSIINELY